MPWECYIRHLPTRESTHNIGHCRHQYRPSELVYLPDFRSYLCLYLSYMDVTALVPKHREDDRVLTQDEKNMRWALNKFFYT